MVTSDVTALVYKQMADLKLAREMIQEKEDGKFVGKETTAQVDGLSLSDKDVPK